MSVSTFALRLTETLGPDIVATAADTVTPWLLDWRGLYKGRAQAVIRPRTTGQVAAGARALSAGWCARGASRWQYRSVWRRDPRRQPGQCDSEPGPHGQDPLDRYRRQYDSS